jgi:hypothetical protein
LNKERYQNPAVGDTVNLRLFTYNSNNLADLSEIETVEIYHLDPDSISASNPDGRRLVESFDGSVVTSSDTGTYMITVSVEEKKYVIGTYIDIWTVKVSDDQPSHQIVNKFQIYSNLWYTTPIPVVYDFSFRFLPNKFRYGSKQYLIIEISPNVPTAGELRAYYENLAIVSDLRISIEQNCGDCLPAETDLRLKVDKELVDYREKRYGYYKIDTEGLDMTCGIYDVWFQLDFGDNRYISDRMHIQIYN